ncbi:hypothetical protein ACFMQL_20260 [Nonomuraea fastidiosa]|uniref:hypothetical protein n=1 Tax=Nonomuraea fastidiosa TaxID=46173 RepID=UPI0036719A1D
MSLTKPSEQEITDMLRAIAAPPPSDPVIRPARRPVWRDPDNPAEKAMTTYDEWAYRWEKEQ